MEKEEFEKLVIGDTVYIFRLDISSHSAVTFGLILKLELTSKDEFTTKRVISAGRGRLLKIGDTIQKVAAGVVWVNSRRISYINFFKDYNEGVEYWNQCLREAEDRLTYEYEKKKKKLLKRLINEETK